MEADTTSGTKKPPTVYPDLEQFITVVPLLKEGEILKKEQKTGDFTPNKLTKTVSFRIIH